jgi:hypothetical protein
MLSSMKEARRANSDVTASPCPGTQDRARNADAEAVFDSMENMWHLPPWYNTWALFNGSLELILGAAYIFASILLLVVRRGAAAIFIGVLTASMLRNAAAFGIALWAGSFMAFWTVSSSATGFLIDLVPLTIVLISDRSAYARPVAGT